MNMLTEEGTIMASVPYNQFVSHIADVTGLKPSDVKGVFLAAPEALMQLEEGNWVKTPLGVFRMTRRKPRRLLIPGTDQEAMVDERMVVRLKSGSRLQRDPDEATG